MSKGLDALNDIKENKVIGVDDQTWELADYERNRISIIEKELKALEIIKNKRFDVDLFFVRRHILTNNNPKDFTEKEYCDDLNFLLRQEYRARLTQEEYDLLKEVLSCA